LRFAAVYLVYGLVCFACCSGCLLWHLALVFLRARLPVYRFWPVGLSVCPSAIHCEMSSFFAFPPPPEPFLFLLINTPGVTACGSTPLCAPPLFFFCSAPPFLYSALPLCPVPSRRSRNSLGPRASLGGGRGGAMGGRGGNGGGGAGARGSNAFGGGGGAGGGSGLRTSVGGTTRRNDRMRQSLISQTLGKRRSIGTKTMAKTLAPSTPRHE
ncbi:unnamed protein product, partial [Laminaria digitata]